MFGLFHNKKMICYANHIYHLCNETERLFIVVNHTLEAPTRFELVMRVLQTRALPLGDGAILSLYGAGGRGRTDTDG